MNKKLRVGDLVIRALIWLSAGITVFILVGIILYVFIRGLPHVSWELLTTAPSELKGTVGILPIMINTVYTVAITLLIATPVGICSAIYLTEYAKKGRLVRLIEFTTETLAGIPSIIYGLFGFVFFCILFGLGYSILAGALTLTIMILPTIIRTTQEALRTVPPAYREGALGMGASKLYVIRTIVLPSAMPGILTGVILSIGRIVGESAALIFTAGISYSMPQGFFRHLFSSGATMTVQLYQYAMRGEHLSVSFSIAAVLIIVVLLINFATKRLTKALNRKNRA